MRHLLDYIPPFFKNFYFLSSLFFIVWLAFIDSNDLFMQGQLSIKKSDLESTKAFYEEKIMEVKNEREALLSNPALLEKLAREKYFMKRPGEDLYVVVE